MNSKKIVNVVAAVIRNGETVYATQRGYGEFKDGWEFPGGKIEAGETPEEALKREIREELGIEISVGELIDPVEYDYPEFHLRMQCFWTEISGGEIELREHEAARWLNADELNDVEWLPADLELVEKIRKTLEDERQTRLSEN